MPTRSNRTHFSLRRMPDGRLCRRIRALILAAIFGSCLWIAIPSPAAQSSDHVQILLWHQWRAGKQRILESIVNDFNCRHPAIEVIAEPLGPSAGTIAERLLMDTGGARRPDIALVEREAVPLLANARRIVPCDELLSARESGSSILLKNNLLDAATAYATYEGKLYGFPMRLNPLVIIYNPDALSSTDTSGPPRDWRSLVELAKSPKNAPGNNLRQWALSVRSPAALFHILCVQQGVDPFDARDNDSASEATEKILRFIRDLRDAHAALPPHVKYWDPNFIGVESGRTLLQLDDAAMLANMLETASIPLAAAMPPCDVENPRTYLASAEVLVTLSATEKAGAISDFLEFLYSPEPYAKFAEEMLFVSPFRSTNAAIVARPLSNVVYGQIVSAAEHGSAYPLHANSATAFPQIDRAVEQLDAGLVSPEQARQVIVDPLSGGRAALNASPSPSIRVSWAESTRRLFADGEAAFSHVPVRLVSARNEHETFQIAFSAGQVMEKLNLDIAPFTSVDGAVAEARIAAYLETDALISTPLVGRERGLYPNVLQPLKDFDLRPGTLTRIWVDVYVPDDAGPGEYRSEITVRNGESELTRVPVHLRVLPLTIPRKPSHPATVGLNYDLIACHYGVEEGSDAYRALMDSYYWFLVDRRLSPYSPPVPVDSAELTHYMNDGRVSAFRLALHPADPRFQEVITAARQGGWLDKLFVYFIDEPTYHQYVDIVDVGRRIHSFPVSPKFMVTCFPDEPLVGAVDIWCIHMRFLPEGISHGFADRSVYAAAVESRIDAGDDVWWYTAGAVRPFPTLHIEDDPAAFRVIPWLQRLYRINGFLHWETANWQQPLDEPFVPSFGNGEGVLLYPGSLGPMPSIRLELLREGLEDMELLELLRRTVGTLQEKLDADRLGDAAAVRVREFCRRVISDDALYAQASSEVLLAPHFIRSAGRIERVREELAEEVLALKAEPFAVVLTDPEEKQYTESNDVRVFGVVEPRCRIEINGHAIPADAEGYFSVRYPLLRGSNELRIRLVRGRNSKLIFRKIEKR